MSEDLRGRAMPRRFGLALAAIPLVAVALADAVVAVHRSDHPAATASTAHQPKPHSTAVTEGGLGPAPTQALRALLARRGDAVVHHNRAEWLSTVDPKSPAFLRTQAQVFDNMRQVSFASWRYTFDPRQPQLPYSTTQHYHAPVWAPATFELHYQLRGFDPRPNDLLQYPTFVRRGENWYLASLSDFVGEGEKSARDLWDFGPVITLRLPQVLVLGHPGSQSTMTDVADEITAAIPRVSAVWHSPWSHRVVALVPKTQDELAQVVDDFGDLDHIAAVASADVQANTGHPDPVGERIGINPRNWPLLSGLGRQIVLTHELTHVATRAWTGAATPTWLAEGFADYVGYLGSGVPTPFVAQELAADVRDGHVPRQLPPDSQFDGSSTRLAQAYEEAWLACRLIAERWGVDKLTAFYRAVGSSSESPRVAVATAFPQVLHIGAGQFVRDWRNYVRAQLS